MNSVDRLLKQYEKHIAIPWNSTAAAAQRVVFCVYHEKEELKLRARIEEFEIATSNAGHDWILFDVTDTFAAWLSSQRYVRKYYEQPRLLTPLLPRYLDYIHNEFISLLDGRKSTENCVVAIHGVGSLFGLVKVKDVVDLIAPLVKGRLLVFFPGNCENNNYRLLDGYDGWNYLAVLLTGNSDV